MKRINFITEVKAWENRGNEDFVAILPNGKEIIIYNLNKCCFCGHIWESSGEDEFTCFFCGAS